MTLRRDEPMQIHLRMSADRKLRAIVIGQQSRFFVVLEGFDTYTALLEQIARRICEPRAEPVVDMRARLEADCV